MKCIDCAYFYNDCNDRGEAVSNSYCHYKYDDGYAPCEVDDRDRETEDDDEY